MSRGLFLELVCECRRSFGFGDDEAAARTVKLLTARSPCGCAAALSQQRLPFLMLTWNLGRICSITTVREMEGTMTTARRVVIIDNEPAFAETLKQMLDSFGYEVATATDAIARKALDLKDSDIIFVDIRTSKLSWQEVLKQLARQNAKAAIVMMGSQIKPLEDAEKVAKKLSLNLIGAMQKPFRMDDLRDILPGT